MDFHILIVISCVFIASLISLLAINKFLRRKTFEEIIAEKKAMNDKMNQMKMASAGGGGGGSNTSNSGGSGSGGQRKPKKLQQLLKKEQKKEKKQRQRDAREQRDNNTEQDDDSEAGHSTGGEEQQHLVDKEDEEPRGLSKTHVEFEPEPEVLTYPSESATVVTAAIVEKEHQQIAAATHTTKQKQKKDKKNTKTAVSGILLNKNEPVAIKELSNTGEEPALNRFDLNPPKDVVEIKKADHHNQKASQQQTVKKEKPNKKEKQSGTDKSPIVTVANVPPVVTIIESVVVPEAIKEVKQQDERTRQNSPKNQQQSSSNNHNKNNNKQQNKKQQNKDTAAAATRELSLLLDKLSGSDSISVQLLMNLFRRSELNRSEIQILIDYLLNLQQDMPSSHSEWSDDIVQKLKRQLEEKERALKDEHDASIGFQAKLREMRMEMNTERAQINSNTKAYIEKLQLKDQEVTGLNQEVQSLNDKLTLERQQFQSKLQLAKQAGPSQDLIAKIQMLQNELALLVNATQQKDAFIQQQAQNILALEKQRDDLEQVSNNRIFELEQSKTFETELGESKVEIRNLQNALESTKGDLTQARQDAQNAQTKLGYAHSAELVEKQKSIQQLQTVNEELTQQLNVISDRAAEQSKEQTGLQATLTAQLAEREQKLSEFSAKNAELQRQLDNLQQNGDAQQKDVLKLVDTLNADLATRQQEVETSREAEALLRQREKELLEQLHEQKEKNNDLRMKNWKLVEALQLAETKSPANLAQTVNTITKQASASLVQQQQQLQKSTASTALLAGVSPPPVTSTTTAAESIASKDEKQIRELFQRLCPEAVKACAGSALSLSFDQWVEQVLAGHIKQTLAANKIANTTTNTSANNKSTQSNSINNNNNNHNSNHNSHNDDENHSLSHNDTANSNNNSYSRVSDGGDDAAGANSNNGDISSSSDPAEVQKLHTQNAQLKARNDELTKLVTKTGNTLSELESRAREQDEHWRSVVRSKDELILSLQKHSNGGEQDI